MRRPGWKVLQNKLANSDIEIRLPGTHIQAGLSLIFEVGGNRQKIAWDSNCCCEVNMLVLYQSSQGYNSKYEGKIPSPWPLITALHKNKKWETIYGTFLATSYFTYTDNSAVDLGRVLTLHIRILQSCHLQHTHPKCINIHRFIIMFFIHFWCHEFRSTYGRDDI